MAHTEAVLFTLENRVGTITLNRPDRLNAFNRDMLLRLAEVIEEAVASDDVRTLVITGAGRAFSAGQDLSERDPRGRSEPFDLEAIQKELFHPIVTALTETVKPVVMAVNGLAAGAGSSLALAGDIVIAARSARFIQSFAKVGLSVDAGGGWHLVKALGPARARALLLTGGAIGAEEAANAGLIWRCVDDDAFAGTIADLARHLADGPKTAYAAIKTAVAAAGSAPDFGTYLAEEARLQGMAGASPDYAEGVLSFLEKRPTRFGA